MTYPRLPAQGGDPRQVARAVNELLSKSDAATTALADGNKGDITVAASGAVWTINAGAVAAGDISGLGYFATGTDAANLTGTVDAARIADASLSIAKTSGLQTSLDAKANLSGATFTGPVAFTTATSTGAVDFNGTSTHLVGLLSISNGGSGSPLLKARNGTSSLRVGTKISFDGATTGLTQPPSTTSNMTFEVTRGGAVGFSWFTAPVTNNVLVEQMTLSPAGDLSVNGNFSASNLTSGTYTPTLTGTANVSASTAYSLCWTRIGNIVTVSGRVDITPTANTTSTQIRMTLPVASNLADVGDVAGVGATNPTAGSPQASAISADTVNEAALLTFTSAGTTSRSHHFSFTYQVI